MDHKKETLYTIVWTQIYPEWQEYIDKEMNDLLEASGYKEANELIERIKRIT